MSQSNLARQMERSVHIPVLEKEVIEYLCIKQGGEFLDCTLGGGGHATAILKAHPANQVIGVDRDGGAVKRTKRALKEYEDRFITYKAAFSELRNILGDRVFDGILADLGISSDQLAEGRGFSFQDEGSLDMRMDDTNSITAFDIINNSHKNELRQILFEGEVGKYTNMLTHALVKARPIKTPKELALVVNQALAGGKSKRKINPATLVFQAIRMAVNAEQEELKNLLETIPSLVKPKGGRVAIICFHSLEDKLVTRSMRKWQTGDDTPALWPKGINPYKGKLGKLLTPKAVTPSTEEVQANPRSRSARLRVFEFFINEA